MFTLCRYVYKYNTKLSFRYFELSDFNFNGTEFPTPIKQIIKFEKPNDNISMNVGI